MSKAYYVTEIFYAPQGEGGRAGEPSIFIRFRGCNMACDIEPGPRSPGGFRCDTDFSSGKSMGLNDIYERVKEASDRCKWIVLTGGEPAQQVDTLFIDYFKNRGFKLAIESNGTIALPEGLDWICISPKTAEHAVKQLTANEVKYVRSYDQCIPVPACKSELKYVSPAFDGHGLEQKNLEWCLKLIQENPEWRLSVQFHKLWRCR